MQCRKHGLKTPSGGCGLSAQAEQPRHRMVRFAFVGRAEVRGVAALWRGDLAHTEDAFLMMSCCICARGYVTAHPRQRASTFIFSMATLTHIHSNKCSHVAWLTWQNRPMCQSRADQQDLEVENHKAFWSKYAFLLIVHSDKHFLLYSRYVVWIEDGRWRWEKGFRMRERHFTGY